MKKCSCRMKKNDENWMQNNWKGMLGMVLAGVMTLAVCACGAVDTVTGNSQEKDNGIQQAGDNFGTEDLKKITFVLDWTPNTNHTGLYVAQNLGYFTEAGLEVTIVQPPEDGATTMVASGQAQFGIDFQDYLAPVFTSEEKLPVTAVAALIQHNTSGIISLKEDEIVSPADMMGKNYATWDLPIEHAILDNVIATDGGDFEQVKLIPEYVTDVPTALLQDIDAVWIYYAWDGVSAELAGLDTNFFYFKDLNPVFDYYSPVIIANTDYLEENGDIARAFLDAVRKGYEYAIANPDAAAEILCEEVPELDFELVTVSQNWLADQYKAEVEQWGYINPERWDTFYAWLYENELSEEIPPGTGFTNDYLSK